MKLSNNSLVYQDSYSVAHPMSKISMSIPLETVNPSHEQFDFNLWASLVREKMKSVLQK